MTVAKLNRPLDAMHVIDVEREYGQPVAELLAKHRELEQRWETTMALVDELLNVERVPSPEGVELVKQLDAILRGSRRTAG